jgi:hypothetical protein
LRPWALDFSIENHQHWQPIGPARTFSRLDVRQEPGPDRKMIDLHLAGAATLIWLPLWAATLDIQWAGLTSRFHGQNDRPKP